jgi:hypothetical protein
MPERKIPPNFKSQSSVSGIGCALSSSVSNNLEIDPNQFDRIDRYELNIFSHIEDG